MAVPLERGEFIQKVEIQVRAGVVAGINRSVADWDYSVTWDNPALQVVSMSARHFSSGLDDIRRLDGFISVAADRQSEEIFKIEAVLTTEKTDLAGGGRRQIKIGPEKILLKSVKPG